MEYAEYVDAIRANGAALADAARGAGIDAAVPSCPEWKVADLVGHVGRLHRWVAQIVTARAAQPDGNPSVVETPSPDELIDWFAAGVPLVADALADAGPGVEMWTWTSDHSSGFWARRQANETAMHRVDAQLATASPEPIAHALAVDGIDELFDLVPFWPRSDQVRGGGETLHFHSTDGDGEWFVVLGADDLKVTREHAKGDVAARGTASDLLLFLYGRVAPDRLEVFGDASLLTRWRELVSW